MLPKWFDDWNKKNPTNIFGPGILVGVVGTAYYTDDPIVPEGGEPLAKDIYENVQVLGELTEDNFNRVMLAMTQWVSPDEGCAYCHGDGDLETYGSDDLYTKVVSRRMIQMTQVINEEWDGHVNANEQVGVNCSTCHRGQNVPSNIWFKNTPISEKFAGWSANQNRATSTSQFTSLPSDHLEKLLVDYGQIGVHDLESRVAGSPADEGYPQIWRRPRCRMRGLTQSVPFPFLLATGRLAPC